ncbi:hypothetical protein HXX76_006455 [Chlamydomonas incerta]|uniref:Uncharacterized protein n=1 Tax=Chlamydomonas incerta TaxID=51695 RepID=A0A835T3Z9_CHLIN|nr:hypothetical protein HXX76_006455 [Chlamydomonas incerta]|eukprot:KAG2436936.1 hypothetical protein HXX76_006455 [Chlamydomonas incerta]
MLMPFLDAASRSSGVASTSGVDRGGRYGGPHARGAASGRSPASASNRLLSTVAAAAASTAATAAGPGAGAGAASPVPLELAERVAAAAVDAVSQPGWMPRGAGSGKGSSSSSSSSSNSSLEVAGGGASREGNGTGRGAGADLAPWHPDAELLPPSTLQQLPEGDEHYTVADDAEDMDGDEEDDDDGADRRGRRRRGRRSSNSEASNLDPLDAPLPRRPRHPSRAEHRMLRQQAAVHQLALRPRAPAPEDLRLTSRIMTCTHWSQLLPLLADHAEAHDRRQRQQHHPQGGKGSRAQSPGARSSGSSSRSSSESGSANGKAAAGLNVLAAAAAAAASGHVPMAALPYTPQHVAAALQRTAQLVEHGAGPGSAADARRLHGLVDCLARLAAALLPSPGMGLREVTSVFHSLVRLRHPVGKPYYIALMTTARQRFSAAAAATALPAAGAAASPASAGAAGAAADASGSRTGAAAAGAAHDLSLLIWCVAACGMSGLRADWAAAYSAALQPVATSLAPQGVAMALYGLARLRSPPPPALLADLCGQLVQHMEAAGAALEGASVDGSEWEAVKACASRCAEEERQRVWWQQQQQQQLTGAAGPSGVEASPNGTNGVDHNAGGNGNGTSSSSSSSSSSSTGGQCRPVDVSLSLWALATLRLPPGGFCPRLLPAAERYSLAHLPDFPQQELSNLMWALARLQHRPSPAFMARLYDTTWVLLPELQPQALSTLLYSLAQMGAAPEQAWLAAAAGCAAEALPGFAPQSMALTVYALAVLGYRPQDSWLQTFHSQLEAQRGGVDTRVRDKVREAYRIMAFRPAGAGGAGAAGAEPHGARGSSSGGAGGAASGTRRGGAAAGSGTGTAPGLRAAPSRWQATAAADRAPSQPAARRAGRPDVRQSPATAATGGAQQADAAAGAALEAEPGEADVSLPHQAEDAASPAVSVLVRPSRFGF